MRRTTTKKAQQSLKTMERIQGRKDQLDHAPGLDHETDVDRDDPDPVQAPGPRHRAKGAKRVVEMVEEEGLGQHRRLVALRRGPDLDDHEEDRDPVQLLRDQDLETEDVIQRKGIEVIGSQEEIGQDRRGLLDQTVLDHTHLDLDPGHDIAVEIDIGQVGVDKE